MVAPGPFDDPVARRGARRPRASWQVTGGREGKMDVFTMVVVIVLASLAAGIANNILKNKRLETRGQVNGSVREELDALRARVEVLEEIVTDSRYQLNAELERLERQR
jgi:hypothetical protein